MVFPLDKIINSTIIQRLRQIIKRENISTQAHLCLQASVGNSGIKSQSDLILESIQFGSKLQNVFKKLKDRIPFVFVQSR